MLIDTIVVTGNSAGADIDTSPHNRIAHISQMVGFALCRNLRVFNFYKVTNMNFVRQYRTRSNACIG